MNSRSIHAFVVTLALVLFTLSSGQAAPAKENVLWDTWYTVTILPKTPYSYYREKVAKDKDGKLHFLNYVWKKEGEFINQEQLGALAENDSSVSPLFFNFHSVYRTTETNIDGNVHEGHLVVKVKKGQEESPVINKMMPKGAFFSVFFPIWLGKHLDQMKEGQTQPFATLLEDNTDLGFATVNGDARLEKADEYAKKTGTRKLALNTNGIRTYWWVDSKGMAIKIDMPEQKMVIEIAPQAKAESFFN